ncbi:MAG: hypothetical protein JRI23_34305 [Deltaproteobacteria bacterium]|jgi:hypothetical protein|nr:hypothetical protein [Deltaproteobacteria bacterium]MBW2537371.1 hypothetical protein [Deltaproteobacteria bacterium]
MVAAAHRYGALTLAMAALCLAAPGCEWISGVHSYQAGEQGDCVAPEDCPGTDTTCRKRKCDRGECGFDDAPDGTACTEDGGTLCNGGYCGECLVTSDCPGQVPCIGGLCTTGQLGEACQRPENCLSGHCVDDVCCEHSCAGYCEACSREKVCGAQCAADGAPCPHQDGVCGPVRANTDPDGECSVEGEACMNRACTAAKLVFVTSGVFTGDLGGVAGGDAECQALAEAACLTGSYKAWLSDDTSEPNTRFTRATVPYYLVDGSVVADDYDDIIDGTLQRPIDLDESGLPGPTTSSITPDRNQLVWTGTDPDGTLCRHSNVTHPIGDDETGNPRTCQDWTYGVDGTDNGTRVGTGFGWYPAIDVHWTVTAVADNICGWSMALYCFEQ